MKDPHSAPASGLITRHLRITGRVQGVGYRWNMAQQAQRLGVNGWVRNKRDGSVEALIQGPASQVLSLIEWAQQGPKQAQVADVAVTVAEALEVFGWFEQRDTR